MQRAENFNNYRFLQPLWKYGDHFCITWFLSRVKSYANEEKCKQRRHHESAYKEGFLEFYLVSNKRTGYKPAEKENWQNFLFFFYLLHFYSILTNYIIGKPANILLRFHLRISYLYFLLPKTSTMQLHWLILISLILLNFG